MCSSADGERTLVTSRERFVASASISAHPIAGAIARHNETLWSVPAPHGAMVAHTHPHAGADSLYAAFVASTRVNSVGTDAFSEHYPRWSNVERALRPARALRGELWHHLYTSGRGAAARRVAEGLDVGGSTQPAGLEEEEGLAEMLGAVLRVYRTSTPGQAGEWTTIGQDDMALPIVPLVRYEGGLYAPLYRG